MNILRIQGRRAEVRSEIEKAIRLQPAAAILRVRRAALLCEDREYDQALVEAQTAADLTNRMPAYPMALWLQGVCLEQKGRMSEAESKFRLALTHQPHDPFNEPSLGRLLARTGRTAEAEAILAGIAKTTGARTAYVRCASCCSCRSRTTMGRVLKSPEYAASTGRSRNAGL